MPKGSTLWRIGASHYIISPEEIIAKALYARLEIHPDDTIKDKEENNFKQYLLCDKGSDFQVKYCHDVVKEYHTKLLKSFLD